MNTACPASPHRAEQVWEAAALRGAMGPEPHPVLLWSGQWQACGRAACAPLPSALLSPAHGLASAGGRAPFTWGLLWVRSAGVWGRVQALTSLMVAV